MASSLSYNVKLESQSVSMVIKVSLGPGQWPEWKRNDVMALVCPMTTSSPRVFTLSSIPSLFYVLFWDTVSLSHHVTQAGLALILLHQPPRAPGTTMPGTSSSLSASDTTKYLATILFRYPPLWEGRGSLRCFQNFSLKLKNRNWEQLLFYLDFCLIPSLKHSKG